LNTQEANYRIRQLGPELQGEIWARIVNAVEKIYDQEGYAMAIADAVMGNSNYEEFLK